MATVLIGGGSGLVGTHLSRMLRDQQHEVLHLSRKKNLQAEFPRYAWNLNQGTIDQEAVERADYIINLAGAGIADRRWTPARKKLIIDSRTQSTLLLKTAIQKATTPPKAFISASAVGYYGNRGTELLTETAPPKPGDFLSDSTVAWEKAIDAVRETGIRVATLRIGIVLSSKGGALPKLLLPVRFRLGTYFGDGQMFYSWIHIDDLCRMFIHLMEKEEQQGVFNAVAPNPSTNYDMTKAIAKSLGVWMIPLPAPTFALRLFMGEMADVVLSSTRVDANKITKAGYQFRFPELVPALDDILRRKI